MDKGRRRRAAPTVSRGSVVSGLLCSLLLAFACCTCLAEMEGVQPLGESGGSALEDDMQGLDVFIRDLISQRQEGAGARLGNRQALDVTLDQALDLAREQNLSIKAQQYRVDQSALTSVQTKSVFDPLFVYSLRLNKTEYASRTALIKRLREKEIDFDQLEQDFADIADGNPPEESDICLIVDGEVINEDTCTSDTEISTKTEFASIHTDPKDTVTASVDVSKTVTWGGSMSVGLSTKYREKNGYALPGLDAALSVDDPLGNGTRYRWSSTFALTFSTPLPFTKNFGRLGNTSNVNRLVARENEERAYWSYGVTSNSVAADTQRLYWTLVRRALEVRAAVRHRVTLAERVAHTKRLFEREQITQYELRQVEASFENLRNIEETAIGEYAKASNALAEILDLGRDQYLVPVDYADQLKATYVGDAGSALATSFDSRPELKVAVSDVKTSSLVYRNRKIQTRPDIQLVISYSMAQTDAVLGYPDPGDSLDNIFDPDRDDAFVGIFYRRPFGNRAAKSQMSQARLRKQQAEEQQELTRIQVTEEVNSALAALWARESEIELTRINLQLADEAYQNSLRLREVGTVTEFDVLQNLDSLLDARFAHIDALTSYQAAYVDLAAAQGLLAEYPDR